MFLVLEEGFAHYSS